MGGSVHTPVGESFHTLIGGSVHTRLSGCVHTRVTLPCAIHSALSHLALRLDRERKRGVARFLLLQRAVALVHQLHHPDLQSDGAISRPGL
eukprot:scaffold26442_cov185-Isochrysis_galbana.AAC.2